MFEIGSLVVLKNLIDDPGRPMSYDSYVDDIGILIEEYLVFGGTMTMVSIYWIKNGVYIKMFPERVALS